MKQTWKSYFAGMLTSLALFALIGGAVAVDSQIQATLEYTGAKILVNGTEITPTDANGNPVEPFFINGTVYLPISATANALGMDMYFDSSANTVLLIDKPVISSTADDAQPAPAAAVSDAAYILNTATMKIHTPNCGDVPYISPENYREYDGPYAIAVRSGYVPCTRCKPSEGSNEIPAQVPTGTFPTGSTAPATQTPQSTPSISGSSGGSGNANNFYAQYHPEQQQTTDAYVLNTRSMKIHIPSCNDVVRISPDNYSTSNKSLEALIREGYTTCGHCFSP